MKIVALAGILIGTCLLLNVFATVLVVRSSFSTLRQKIIQILIIWFILVFGALIFIALLLPQRENANGRSEGTDHDKWQGGENTNVASHHQE